MDSDLWISRLAAAKRHYSLQHQQNASQADRLGFEEFEVEEEIRPEFPCPYCYEDHDIVSLCSHIEEEHSFESKVAVCPICSVKIMKDMLSHLTGQHGNLFKNHLQRRRRLHKFTSSGNQTLSLLGRDLREAQLQALLGSSGYRSGNNNTANATADSLLSSLILNFPTSEAEENSKAATSTRDDSQKEWPLSSWRLSLDASLSYEEREHRRRQATIRSTFVQDLFFSALFDD